MKGQIASVKEMNVLQDEGFGESAFTGPGLQRAPSAPNLMDFGADTPTPPGSAGSAGHLESSSESIPIRQHTHQGTNIDGAQCLVHHRSLDCIDK